VDYVCAQMAGINPMLVPTLAWARTQGLFDPEALECVGVLETIKGYALPLQFPFRNSIVQAGAQVLYRLWLGRVPVINPAHCTRCGACENVCPVRAVKDQTIDYRTCIKCYCCREVCPADAIKIRLKI
jgi:NAD-dependent dihydropyrimidine dehydrogenase PreA subunit